MIGANDGAIGILLPSLRAHYGVDKGTISLVFLLVTAGFLVAATSSGLLVHRLGARLFLSLGGAAFFTAVATIWLMPPFLALLLAMLIMGFGLGIIDAGLNAYVAGLPNNSALLNYLHAFYGLGALLGPAIATIFLEVIHWSWNSVYLLWVTLSLLVLAGFATLFRERSDPAQPVLEAHTGNVLAASLKLRVVWLAAFFLLFYVGAEVTLGTWSFSLLTEERHEPALLSGWVVSGFWLGLTLGRASLGWVAQRLGNVRLIQLCLAGVVVGMILVWLVPAMPASAAGLWLAGFSLGPIFPTTIALASQLVPPRLLPSAVGFLASLGSSGAALFPWLAGNLAEWVGLWLILPYVVALTIAMLALWFALQASSRPTQPQTP
jgi:fucose permease